MELFMKKSLFAFVVSLLLLSAPSASLAQVVKIGPRITGNYNIYNEKGLTGSWSAIGIGVGGTVDVSFSQHIGLMVNLTLFDMRNWGNSITQNNQTTEYSRTLSYLTIDPMFKAEFSGFYMIGGPSLGIKLGSSGTNTVWLEPATISVFPKNYHWEATSWFIYQSPIHITFRVLVIVF